MFLLCLSNQLCRFDQCIDSVSAMVLPVLRPCSDLYPSGDECEERPEKCRRTEADCRDATATEEEIDDEEDVLSDLAEAGNQEDEEEEDEDEDEDEPEVATERVCGTPRSCPLSLRNGIFIPTPTNSVSSPEIMDLETADDSDEDEDEDRRCAGGRNCPRMPGVPESWSGGTASGHGDIESQYESQYECARCGMVMQSGRCKYCEDVGYGTARSYANPFCCLIRTALNPASGRCLERA